MSGNTPLFLEAVTSPNAAMSLNGDQQNVFGDQQTPMNVFGGVASNCADEDRFGDDVRCGFGNGVGSDGGHDTVCGCDGAGGDAGGGADVQCAINADVGGGASKGDGEDPMAPKRVQAPSFVQTTPKPLMMPSVRFAVPPPNQKVCALRVGGPQYEYSPCAAVGFTCAGCFPSEAEAAAFYAHRTRAGDELFGPIVTFPLDKPFLIGSNLPQDAAQQAARIAEILRKSAAATKQKAEALMDDIRQQRSWEDQDAMARPTQADFARAYTEKWTLMQPALEERARKLKEAHPQAQTQAQTQQQQAAKKKKKKRGNNWSRKKKRTAQTAAATSTASASKPAAGAGDANWPDHLLVPDQHSVVFALAFDPDDKGPLKEQYVVTVFGAESSAQRATAFISDCVQRDRKNNGPIFSHPMFTPILPDLTNLDGFERSVATICETSEQQDLMDAMDPNSELSMIEARQVAELEAQQAQATIESADRDACGSAATDAKDNADCASVQ